MPLHPLWHTLTHLQVATYAWLAFAFIVLQALDTILTLTALAVGAQEANPIAAWLMRNMGKLSGLVMLKLLMCASLAAYAYAFFITLPQALACVFIYTAVAANNFRIYTGKLKEGV